MVPPVTAFAGRNIARAAIARHCLIKFSSNQSINLQLMTVIGCSSIPQKWVLALGVRALCGWQQQAIAGVLLQQGEFCLLQLSRRR